MSLKIATPKRLVHKTDVFITHEMKAIIIIIFVMVTKTLAVCDKENSVELTNRTHNGIRYKEGEYFVDNITGIERGCVCDKEICIRKCCPLNQVYDATKRRCVDSTRKFLPPVHDMTSQLIPRFNATKEFNLLFNKMTCLETEARIAILDVVEEFQLKMDGQLYFEMEEQIPSQLVYGPHRYCVDTFLSQNSKGENISTYNALVCLKFEPDENHYAFNATCMLISCIFIILVVAVYGFLPELRTLYGMVMIAYLMSFFVAFLLLAIMHILLLVENINQTQCTGMTFVIYFALLAAFFWLNVMCYDLWSKLRITNMAHGFTQSKQVRFLIYCAYAFGVPTALTILLAALEFSNLPVNIKLLPHLRRQGCFIAGLSKLLYLYVPIMLLCAANLLLFILTARKIAETKRQTQMLNKKDTQRLSLYIKLFIVTGINWILEVTSAMWPQIPYIWQFTDAYNILVGLIIFILFVCKKKIFIAIKKRYETLMGQESSSKGTTTTTTSTDPEEIQMRSK